MKLKTVNDGNCDIVRCKTDWDLRLERGASLLNPRRQVKLCQSHWVDWLKTEDILRKEVALPSPQGAHHKPRMETKE